MTTIDLQSETLALAKNAKIHTDDAQNMYDCYGWHMSTERAGDVCLQAVHYEWIEAADGEAEPVIAKLRERNDDITADEAESIVKKAMGVYNDMLAIEALLDDAVTAYLLGDRAMTIESLREASFAENAHGDDPSCSDLASRLLIDSESE
jgi:hypothetical protein